MEKYWKANTTFKYRYDALGIIDYMLKYAKSSTKNRLTVIDVGCSRATATRFAKTCLNGHGIKSVMIGIDNSVRVADDAEKNLDEFILNDVMNVEEHYGSADVVICSMTIRNVNGEIRSRVLEKCTEFLKDDGVIITDVKGYDRPITDRGFSSIEKSNPEKICSYPCLESVVVFMWGMHRKDTHMMGKNDTLEYAKQIKREWDNNCKGLRFSLCRLAW